ncbi:MAG: divalent metal cation transporter [Pseudomonadales bacterium]|nr:divalent metal cation transporter [Pseudomonadales bacterium]
MNLLKTVGEKLGPGMLFAAACVGTSHLVQSTRAGADYGLALWWVILLACFIKYPVFYFGSAYAAATKESLIESYFRQGRWAVCFFSLELFVNMFIATSAVALITGGLLNNILGLGFNPLAMTSILLVTSSILLISGKYHLFEKITTAFVVLFTVLILIAVLLAFPNLTLKPVEISPLVALDTKTILFIIAFAGWMPTAVGASVFQSLWVCAKSKDLKRPVTPQEARFDFNLGYFGTMTLAFCFLLLGAVFMRQEGIAISESAAGFAGQFMGLFTQAIGQWAYPIIAIAAIAIMFSTLLTLMDACPRALAGIINTLRAEKGDKREPLLSYNSFIVLQCLGAILIILLFMRSFKSFIDFATSVAFLVAPFIAFINHRAMFSSAVPLSLQPGLWLKMWSLLGMLCLATFAFCYLYFGVFN